MSQLLAALDPAPGGCLLRLRVQPRAKRSQLAGLHGDALKLRIQAPPVDGKANAAVLEFLAEVLGVRKDALELVAGQSGRSKRVRVEGLEPEEAAARLEAAG